MNNFPPGTMHGVTSLFVDIAQNVDPAIFWLIGAVVFSGLFALVLVLSRTK
jgi:hypothetical protein